ncbi:hypothetical protein ACIQTU_08655 [Brevundimonas sp. NPDC090276]|uniref:hypothetical protein n=1 Tax=Brevundimonas sp. NPDC090276 TaxID=3363956 RepID=UPI00383A5C97
MTDDIDRLIGAAPCDDFRLNDLHADVWRRIEQQQTERRLGQVRMAALAMALVVGAANGGLFALTRPAAPSEIQVFSLASASSPLLRVEAGQ